ncbi:MAG TPA: carbonic anhydrase [Pseudonocardia sp.]
MSLHDVLSRRPNPTDVQPDLAGRPAEQVAVVTCMDCRIAALDSFGLKIGDAHVIRNAGAAVTSDVIRSLSISQRKLGTRGVVLMAHTGCGMATFTDDDYVTELVVDAGQEPSWRPMTFTDPAEHVRRGMATLRDSPFLLGDTTVRGFVIDLKTGDVNEVDGPAES